MSFDAKNIVLKDVAEIRPGYPFRSAIEDDPEGDAAVVQMKNADADSGIDWPSVVKTTLMGRRKPDWLKDGDILFSARGNRNVAVYVDEPPTAAVCSPHFFLVRIKDGQKALPEFVKWLINQPAAQRYFAQSATGSFISNIRRNVLEEMPLSLPSIERQESFIRLVRSAQREQRVMNELYENRKKQLFLIARTMMSQATDRKQK